MIQMPWTAGSFGQVSKQAIEMASANGDDVEFKFNEIPIVAHSTSDWRDLAEIYELAFNLRNALGRLGARP